MKKTESSFRWAFWFCCANALLALLISTQYLKVMFLPSRELIGISGQVLVAVFLFLASIGHFALLSFLAGLLLLPFLFLKKHSIRDFFASVVFSLLLTLLITDTVVYNLYRLHINGIFLTLFTQGGGKEIFGIGWQEYQFVFLSLGVLFVLEYFLAKTIRKITHYKIQPTAIALSGCALISTCFILLASSDRSLDGKLVIRDHAIATQARLLPLYYTLIGKLLPERYNVIKLQEEGRSLFSQPEQTEFPLNYPRHALRCHPQKKPLNILMIGLDAWRADMLKPEVTPHLYAFSKNSWVFTNHRSGGNGTKPGLFSLFYGLPVTYWTSMLKQHQPPILFQALNQAHYQQGVFTSAENFSPAYNKTIFSSIKNLKTTTPGDNPALRDAAAGKRLSDFLKKTHSPFFGLVFFNASHGYCEPGKYPTLFKPIIKACERFNLTNETDPTPYKNRYKNALHYVDGLANQILQQLKKQKRLENTVVILFGDHGEEFNDHHKNYWGHAGNFTDTQIGTPLIIHWPGKPGHIVHYPTSHYDLVPTLMQTVLGCENPADDYSIGASLLTPHQKNYLLLGSYIDFAIREADRITTVYPTGNYVVYSLDYERLDQAKPHLNIVQKAFGDMHRFYGMRERNAE